MPYFNFRNGFSIQTASAIDSRLLMTKKEMLEAEDNYMLPDVYLCLCTEDGKLYLYNSKNDANETTGKYRVIDDTISFDTTAAQAAITEAINGSVTITTLTRDVSALKETVNGKDGSDGLVGTVSDLGIKANELDGRVGNLETAVSGLKLDDITGTVDGGIVTGE